MERYIACLEQLEEGARWAIGASDQFDRACELALNAHLHTVGVWAFVVDTHREVVYGANVNVPGYDGLEGDYSDYFIRV